MLKHSLISCQSAVDSVVLTSLHFCDMKLQAQQFTVTFQLLLALCAHHSSISAAAAAAAVEGKIRQQHASICNYARQAVQQWSVPALAAAAAVAAAAAAAAAQVSDFAVRCCCSSCWTMFFTLVREWLLMHRCLNPRKPHNSHPPSAAAAAARLGPATAAAAAKSRAAGASV